MTEPQNEEFEEKEELLFPKDPMLSTLVRFAEEQGISLGVTLTVHGLLISGNIIGYREYLEGIAQTLESANDSEIGEALANAYRESGEEYSKTLQEKGLEEFTPQYIHLSNARFLLGNSIVPTETGVYWRGQLDEVDGFSFGAMSPAR